MLKNILIALVSSMFLVGCIEMPDYDQHSNDQVSDISNEYGIVLNDGAKWTVDPEMMEHIPRMEEKVSSFEGNDYKELSVSLMEDINLLTSNCTMKGQAHDELHKWLLPYIDLVDELEKTKDKESQHDRIVSSFETFNEYFE